MERILISFLLVLLSSTLYGQGLIPTPAEVYAAYPSVDWKVLAPKALTDVPSSHILPHPPVGDQGVQDCSTAWAIAYAGLGSLGYQRYSHNWDALRRSPAFVYNSNKINEGASCSGGAFMSSVAIYMSTTGACSWELMPYDGKQSNSCGIQPTTEAKADAYRNRCDSRKLEMPDLVNPDSYRMAIANGKPVAVAINISETLQRVWYSGQDYTADSNPRGRGNAVCVIGYDDNEGAPNAPGGRGRLIAQNSWGETGGRNHQGLLYISYDLVRKGIFKEGYVLFDITPEKLALRPMPTFFSETITVSANGVSPTAPVNWIVEGPATYEPGHNRLSIELIPTGAGPVTLTVSIDGERPLVRTLWAKDRRAGAAASQPDPEGSNAGHVALKTNANIPESTNLQWQFEHNPEDALYAQGGNANTMLSPPALRMAGLARASTEHENKGEIFSVSP